MPRAGPLEFAGWPCAYLGFLLGLYIGGFGGVVLFVFGAGFGFEACFLAPLAAVIGGFAGAVLGVVCGHLEDGASVAQAAAAFMRGGPAVVLGVGTLLLVAAVVTIPVAATVERQEHLWLPFCLFNGFLFAGGVFTSFALRIFSQWSAIVFALVFAAGCAFGAWLGWREVGRATSGGMRVGFLLAALGLALGAIGNLLASVRPLRVGRSVG